MYDIRVLTNALRWRHRHT